MLELKVIPRNFSVCQVADYSLVNWRSEFCFTGKRMKKILWYV